MSRICPGILRQVWPDSCILVLDLSDSGEKPVLDTLEAPFPTAPRLTSGWKVITATNLDEVQDLLEALEDLGFNDRKVFIENAREFAVAWR